MIKVNVKKNLIEIIGHANYDDYGKDIVCASVSSIMTTTINAILSFDSNAIYYNVSDNKTIIEIKKTDDITTKLINNMLDLFKELVVSYPKNIVVKESL